ncbi:hypothetical protein OAK02_03110 [Candidatus Nitrosopelagicus sp.]|nr:hypothetical protein [Candidatus Nitrosopelagicus sp.]
MKILLLSVLAVAMIGLMVPSAFAEIELWNAGDDKIGLTGKVSTGVFVTLYNPERYPVFSDIIDYETHMDENGYFTWSFGPYGYWTYSTIWETNGDGVYRLEANAYPEKWATDVVIIDGKISHSDMNYVPTPKSTSISEQTSSSEYVFNESYYRGDHRFWIQHLDWKIFDSTDNVFVENTKNFGDMESVVLFAKDDPAEQGFVEILYEVENSQTMINSIPIEELKKMMMEEAEIFCNMYQNLTCDGIIAIEGSGERISMVGPKSEPTQIIEFMFILSLKFETGDVMDLWKWYRLWNDPYDGKLMWAVATTPCDPEVSKLSDELSCKQVPNQKVKFSPETLEIIGSINTMPTKYTNEEYGFTFTFPPEWNIETFESDDAFDAKYNPGTTMQPIVRFTYPDSIAKHGVPVMFVMVSDTNTPWNFNDSDFSEESLVTGFVDTLKKGTHQGELVYSNTEKIPGGLHIDGKINLQMDLGLAELIPIKMDFHGWMFEDGVTVYYMYMAENFEYDRFK